MFPVPASPSPERLAEVATAAHERHPERRLVDVIRLVGHREHLALVDVIDLARLEYLRLDGVSDARLGHHGYGHGILD